MYYPKLGDIVKTTKQYNKISKNPIIKGTFIANGVYKLYDEIWAAEGEVELPDGSKRLISTFLLDKFTVCN